MRTNVCPSADLAPPRRARAPIFCPDLVSASCCVDPPHSGELPTSSAAPSTARPTAEGVQSEAISGESASHVDGGE